MHGVSEVIAIILILMITISLTGLAYMFMSTTMSDVTASAGSTVDTTTSSMLTAFTIESVDIAKVYVRNTGQNAITSLSVYVNDEPAIYNVTAPIVAGAVGTITIYSFIPDGATVKVTSPNGFSASKIANPCSNAAGCWKFDEESGSTACDSSPYGNDGTVYGAVWTSGRYGNGLFFDGLADFVTISNKINLFSFPMTVTAWVKSNNAVQTSHILYGISTISGDGWGAENETHLSFSNGNISFCSITYNTVNLNNIIYQPSNPLGSDWHYFVAILDTTFKLYEDGVLINSSAVTGTPNFLGYSYFFIGKPAAAYRYFNGTLDEIRVYNRAIY